MSNSQDIEVAVQTVRSPDPNGGGGALNYLINNASHNHFMPILDKDLSVTRKLFDNNIWGPLTLTQAFAPLLIKARGTVVFITSISGYINVPYMGKVNHF